MAKEHGHNQHLALCSTQAQQKEFPALQSFSLEGDTVGGCQKSSGTPAGTGNYAYFNA